MYLDLSHTIKEGMPVYPGDPDVELRKLPQTGESGFSVSEIKSGLHTGTHIDAPAHFLPGGKLVSDFPADKFFGRGVLVDARGMERIDVDSITSPDPSFVRRRVLPGDIMLILTGWSKRYYQKEYFQDFPEMTEEFARKLVDLNIKMVGLDTPSPDRAPFSIHKMLLEKDILLVENLTNLEALLNHQDFEISALPAKFAAEAAPCRVVAKIN